MGSHIASHGTQADLDLEEIGLHAKKCVEEQKSCRDNCAEDVK